MKKNRLNVSKKSLFVVRHAHRDLSLGHTRDNGLSLRGQSERAELERELRRELRKWGRGSSPTFRTSKKIRCRETLAGVARAHGARLRVDLLLGENATTAKVLAFVALWLRSKTDGPWILCTHGDWIETFERIMGQKARGIRKGCYFRVDWTVDSGSTGKR